MSAIFSVLSFKYLSAKTVWRRKYLLCGLLPKLSKVEGLKYFQVCSKGQRVRVCGSLGEASALIRKFVKMTSDSLGT